MKRNIETAKKHSLDSVISWIKSKSSFHAKFRQHYSAQLLLQSIYLKSSLYQFLKRNMNGGKIRPAWWKGSFINQRSPAGSYKSIILMKYFISNWLELPLHFLFRSVKINPVESMIPSNGKHLEYVWDKILTQIFVHNETEIEGIYSCMYKQCYVI